MLSECFRGTPPRRLAYFCRSITIRIDLKRDKREQRKGLTGLPAAVASSFHRGGALLLRPYRVACGFLSCCVLLSIALFIVRALETLETVCRLFRLPSSTALFENPAVAPGLVAQSQNQGPNTGQGPESPGTAGFKHINLDIT